MSGRIVARQFLGQGLVVLVLVVLAGFFTQTWLPGVLFGLAALGLVIIYHRGHFVILYENGIDVRSFWIGRRVAWNQIERVHFHERHLTLTTSPGVPVVYLPLEFENLSSIKNVIAGCAGPNHPLVEGLTRATRPPRPSEVSG